MEAICIFLRLFVFLSQDDSFERMQNILGKNIFKTILKVE